MNKPHLIPVFTTVLLAANAIGQNVSPTINEVATRQFGQSPNAAVFSQPINTLAANLVEGRELSNPYAIAFDTTASPPILYVADTFNNRILAFKNPNNFKPCGINSPTSCGMADLVIGQRDFYSTQLGGPGRSQVGLNYGPYLPTSLAVDSKGALYVYDSGNSRVLRYPSPFKQTVTPLITDLVIGQKTVNVGISPNQGQSGPDDTTLSANTNAPVGLAIEPGTGNLWVSDYGNYRVLRFPVNQLVAGTTLPHADFVLGQTGFTSNTPATTPAGTAPQLNKALVYLPTGIAFDANGNLYVADSYSRVLFFRAGFVGFGQSASRVLGLCEALNATVCANPTLNGYTLNGPAGLFTDGSHLFVADAGNNRIAMYDTPDAWPAAPNPGVIPQVDQDSPPIKAVFGQTDPKTGAKANRGLADPAANTLNSAAGGAFNGTDLWVVDTSNHRVLGFQGQTGSATYLVGQVDFPFRAPNLVEGRELFLSPGSPGGDIAIDHTSNPPHLYIADSFNNRILGFKDARSVKAGQKADIVIGQADLAGQAGSAFYRTGANSPGNDPVLPTQTGLRQPSGVLVDGNGNLWVADTGNARVLRFPQPFAPGVTAQIPTIVLGQQDFTSANTDANQAGMAGPYGLVLLPNSGALVVSDGLLHRLMVFKKPAGGDFKSSVAADVFLGQQTPFNSLPSSSTSGLNSPRHLGVDSSDRVYVADSSNNRLVVFNNPSSAQTGAPSTLQLPMSTPQGVAVSQSTGESWVTLGNGLIWRLPEYNTLQLISNPNLQFYTQQISLQSVPFAIAMDNSSNLIVAEQANRATFYYAKLTYTNAANYNGGTALGVYVTPMAPGQLMEIYRVGQPLNGIVDGATSTDPWPTVLSDLQVTVNGTPAPLFAVSSGAQFVAFQVPTNAPQSGTAEFLLTRASTGEIIMAGSIPMAQYNPGFFTTNSQGFGQAAAQNVGDDGSLTLNSQANPVSRDGKHQIVFYLTGAGIFDGGGTPPRDGYQPTASAKTHETPQMLSASFGGEAPSSSVAYSGAGAFAGGWQINFTVPSTTVPGLVPITLAIGGVASSVGPSGNKVTVTFYAK